MKRFLIPLVLIVGVGVMLWGCNGDDNGGTGPSGPTLAGTWGTQLVVGTDTIDVSLVCGTSSYTIAADVAQQPLYSESGVYTFDGDTATFTPDSCTLSGQPYQPCQPQSAPVVNDTMSYSYLGVIPVSIVKQP
jgi:hypothetical protein